MVHAGEVTGRRVRRWRSIAEKRQIVQLTMAPGASVAELARAHGVNANQVFKWRRAFERGELIEPCAALIPVTISSGSEAAKEAAQTCSGGAIHIELAGRAIISVESGADPTLVRSILESLCK
ncbi:MAG: transposase [Acidobacteriaceae bacterium]|jgi:transposase|nr:transposase [Acidobacteriaceae bacterium]